MSDGKLPFATLVANPTTTSWSQAYTAGKLYAVLSLTQKDDDTQNLASIGKEIINTLVEEYFTLETKNLETIKSAVLQTTKNFPKDLHVSFVVISIVQNILYAFSLGGGCVLIKRGEKIGTILKTLDEEEILHSASGYLKQQDNVVLQTKQSADIITQEQLQTAFETPAEAVEIFSPIVHGTENGGASAIIISYSAEELPIHAPEETVTQDDEEEEDKDEEQISPLQAEVTEKIMDAPSPKRFPNIHISLPKIPFHLPVKTMFFLLIPLLLLLILAAGIYKTRQHQETNQIQQDFDSIYPQAQKKYDEGIALLSLNKPLAQDDFAKAKQIIESNMHKFPSGSSQRKKMEELLTKVKNQGTDDTGSTNLSATETSTSTSPLLAALLKNTSASYATTAENKIYLGSNTSLTDASAKTLIENNDDWKSIGGLGAFGTNIYVLDKGGNQILKFLGGSADAKSIYASGSFSNAADMAIDSSIYVLSTDGTVKKFTKGTPDSFTITSLQTPMKNPTRLFTNADTDNVYVLDKGNGRVLSFDKSGGFQQSYSATILKNATAIDVHEKDKKLYVLASGKVYEITLP